MGVGGQEHVILPHLERAAIAVFVFKERIGQVTWQELNECRNRPVPQRIPVIALFPDKPSSSDKFSDGDWVKGWLDLLVKRIELTEDWNSDDSRSITPVEPYCDHEHMKEIVLSRIEDILPQLIERLEAIEGTIREDPANRDDTGAPVRVSDYPRTALIEGIVNFTIHRDYSSSDVGWVSVYADRIEFMNPGSSLFDSTELQSGDVLVPKYERNRNLIHLFARTKLNQRQGEGLARIRDSLIQNGNVFADGTPAVRIENSRATNRFKIVFYKRSRSRQELLDNPFLAKGDLIDIITTSISDWNQLRSQYPAFIPSLSGANLNGANLENANLDGVDLRGVDLRSANLQDATLRGANLSESRAENAIFTGADLNGASLIGAFASGARFDSADLIGINAREADLKGAIFRAAELIDADLGKADLSEADFTGANLSGTNLTGCNLSGADLRNVMFLSKESEDPEKLTSANLTAAMLANARITSIEESTPSHGFLELASATSLDTVDFDDLAFLPNYLAEAFEYAHRPDLEEAKLYPDFLGKALKNIKLLRSLLQTQDKPPPPALVEVVQTITAELIKYLKAHPKEVYRLKPRQFEELIAEILASFGWQVHLTPASKDGGYDIYAISTDRLAGVETSWIIECKKYSEANKIGIDIVRALYGNKLDLKVANVMLATTSHFTRGAMDYKASRYDLELRDYEGILEWINEYRPNPEGKLYIKDNRLILPGEK